MRKYQRLAVDERYQIQASVQSGMSVRAIAAAIRRSPSAVLRELRRNGKRSGYRAKSAQVESLERRRGIGPPRRITGELEAHVLEKLTKKKWSPEQIDGRLKIEGRPSVSHETIYRYIYADFRKGGRLWTNLRRRRRYRRSRLTALRFKRKHIRTDRTPITERPAEVDLRNRVGDFERDTMVGKKGGSALLTVVDRTTLLLRVRHVKNFSAIETHHATISALKGLTALTLTNDHGPEFEQHHATAKALAAPIYFSRPYCSWERGTVENINGLLRQFFPRRTEIDRTMIKHAQNLLNNRPRKCLGFRTPLEAYRELTGVALSG